MHLYKQNVWEFQRVRAWLKFVFSEDFGTFGAVTLARLKNFKHGKSKIIVVTIIMSLRF
jgi:hypothetical protein